MSQDRSKEGCHTVSLPRQEILKVDIWKLTVFVFWHLCQPGFHKITKHQSHLAQKSVEFTNSTNMVRKCHTSKKKICKMLNILSAVHRQGYRVTQPFPIWRGVTLQPWTYVQLSPCRHLSLAKPCEAQRDGLPIPEATGESMLWRFFKTKKLMAPWKLPWKWGKTFLSL